MTYAEGLTCEHHYPLNDTRCGEPAVWVLWATALCDAHFEDRVAAVRPSSGLTQGDLRLAARALPC